jgi:hypothetical protein
MSDPYWALNQLHAAQEELKQLKADKKMYHQLAEDEMEEEERRPPRKRKRSMSPDSAEEDRTKTRMASGPVQPELYPGRTALRSPVDLRPTEPRAETRGDQRRRHGHGEMQGDSDTLGIFDAMLAAADETTEEEEQQELQRRRETWLASEAGRM